MVIDPLMKQEQKDPPSEALKMLTDMVKCHDRLSIKIVKLLSQAKDLAAEADQIIDNDIPEYMIECGIRELTLRDGRPISCVTKTYGSIKVDDRDKAHAWLRKNGHGALIRNTVTATFGQDEGTKAEQLEALVIKKGFGVKRVEAVNTNTFSAWVREMTEEGKKLPSKLFGIYTKEVVKIGKAKR